MKREGIVVKDIKIQPASERISVDIAAKILGIKPQCLRIWMKEKKIDIGTVVPGAARNGKAAYLIYRAKLAKLLGQPADYVWPEESS